MSTEFKKIYGVEFNEVNFEKLAAWISEAQAKKYHITNLATDPKEFVALLKYYIDTGAGRSVEFNNTYSMFKIY